MLLALITFEPKQEKKKKNQAPPARVTCIHYWERPMNGDLEVCGAVLSFGPSCVRKAGWSESRSAVLSAGPAQRNRLPLFHSRLRCRLGVTAARPHCTHCPPGGLSALIQRDLICVFKSATAPTQEVQMFSCCTLDSCQAVFDESCCCYGAIMAHRGGVVVDFTNMSMQVLILLQHVTNDASQMQDLVFYALQQVSVAAFP